jgi:hypothetical protein
MATGFKKPKVDFLPDELFPDNYQVCVGILEGMCYVLKFSPFQRPNLYLQNFATEDWSVLMTNSAYMNAIGTSQL